MTPFSSPRFPILFSTPNRTRGLANEIQRIDVVALCGEYERLRKTAPRRSARNKRYFVGHDGRPQAKNPGSPSEKHLAIALWRREAQWPRAGSGWMCLLDYQFPLKARRSDAGLGEVDLLGATDEGRLVVIELKVRRKNGSPGDTPLLAVMEALRYAAVVHANHRAIAAEARDGFAINVSEQPPIVQILAPEDWWRGWRDMASSTRAAAGPWEPKFLDLSAELKARLGIVIECASLQGITLADVIWHAHGPRLGKTPQMRRVCLDGALAPAPAPPRGPAVAMVDSTGYETGLLRHLWGWADQHHSKELDGGSRIRVRARFLLKCTLRTSDPELGGVDLDLAVEDDVAPLDRADAGDEFGVEREVGGGGDS